VRQTACEAVRKRNGKVVARQCDTTISVGGSARVLTGRVQLRRDGRLVASGQARAAGRRVRFAVRGTTKLRPGTYVLTIADGNGRVKLRVRLILG
jgi:hypothetical protein